MHRASRFREARNRAVGLVRSTIIFVCRRYVYYYLGEASLNRNTTVSVVSAVGGLLLLRDTFLYLSISFSLPLSRHPS